MCPISSTEILVMGGECKAQKLSGISITSCDELKSRYVAEAPEEIGGFDCLSQPVLFNDNEVVALVRNANE